MHVNLLPRPLLWRSLLRIRGRQWSLAWGTVLIFAALASARQYYEIDGKGKQLSFAERRCKPLREIESESATLGSELECLKQQSLVLDSMMPRQDALRLLAAISQGARRADGRIQLKRFAFQAATEAPKPQGPEPAAPPNSQIAPAALAHLEIQGTSVDDRAVAQFIEGLRQTGMFERVELKSSSELRTSGRSGRQFQVECRLIKA